MSFSKRQKVLIELCVRSILQNLLNEDKTTIDDFTAILHNLNTGIFGEKGYNFDDPTDWKSCREDLLFIIAKLRFDSYEKSEDKLDKSPIHWLDTTDYTIIRETFTNKPSSEYIGDGVHICLDPYEPFRSTRTIIKDFGEYTETMNDEHILQLDNGSIISTTGKSSFLKLLEFLKHIDEQQKTKYTSLDQSKRYFIYNKEGVKFPNSYFEGNHMDIVSYSDEVGYEGFSDMGGIVDHEDKQILTQIDFIQIPSYCE